MTFAEFCHLTEPGIEPDDTGSLEYHKDLLLHRFREYLITGGFPLSVNLFFSNGQISSYVYQLYLSWIDGDIGRSGKLVRNLYQIMSRVLAHMSTGVSVTVHTPWQPIGFCRVSTAGRLHQNAYSQRIML